MGRTNLRHARAIKGQDDFNCHEGNGLVTEGRAIFLTRMESLFEEAMFQL